MKVDTGCLCQLLFDLFGDIHIGHLCQMLFNLHGGRYSHLCQFLFDLHKERHRSSLLIFVCSLWRWILVIYVNCCLISLEVTTKVIVFTCCLISMEENAGHRRQLLFDHHGGRLKSSTSVVV